MPVIVKPSLRAAATEGYAVGVMADDKSMTREERLAAKLRENLHRRKTQSRAHSRPLARDLHQDDKANAALPKMPPKS